MPMVSGDLDAIERIKNSVDREYDQALGVPDLNEFIEESHGVDPDVSDISVPGRKISQEVVGSRPAVKQEFRQPSGMDRIRKTMAEKGWNQPPELERKDLLTKDGRILDFSEAADFHELVEMIKNEEYITNQNGEDLSAETVINLIYKLTYQDIRNYHKEDWTNITLRHNLRATVAGLIDQYKRTPEFRASVGLDLSQIQTKQEVCSLLRQRTMMVDANGNTVDGDTLVRYINNGDLTMLPEPIRFKVIEINKEESDRHIENKQHQENSLGGRLKSGLAKLKFWGRKK